MNFNSQLCNFIRNNPNDWEEKLTNDYQIKIRKEGDLAIFNYQITANFSNPVVQEARGIIIDIKRLEVVCWPFRKFGNYNEYYADEIDWKSAKVLEKVDGSIIKLWFDFSANVWQFSTNKTIRAENACVEGEIELTYRTVITRAYNYKDVPFEKLDKNYTYIFELTSPETRVVINYPQTALYHLGTRNNLTGQEISCDIGIKKPREYPLTNLNECIETANKLNMQNGSEEISNEGFVVVDKNWNRVKIKSIDYVAVHHISTMQEMNKTTCVELLLFNTEKVATLYKKRPDFEHVIKYYEYKLSELFYCADKFVNFTKNLYMEYNYDRKAVANVIKKHPLAFVAFKSLNNELSGRELLKMSRTEAICSLIPDYEPIDILSSIRK